MNRKNVTIIFPHHFHIRCDVEDLKDPKKMEQAYRAFRSYIMLERPEAASLFPNVTLPKGNSNENTEH